MGAMDFENVYIGKKTPRDAFDEIIEIACFREGNDGYTGTIAEKTNFVTIQCQPRKSPGKLAEELMQNSDSRIDDKWGPAGCIEYKGAYLKKLKEQSGLKGKKNIRAYIFFGYASS